MLATTEKKVYNNLLDNYGALMMPTSYIVVEVLVKVSLSANRVLSTGMNATADELPVVGLAGSSACMFCVKEVLC